MTSTRAPLAKVGLDDFLAAGGTADHLTRRSESLSSFEESRFDGQATYAATPAGMVWRKRTLEGAVDVPLANFSATITADVVEDDGVETVRRYELEAVLRGRTHRLRVPATQFASLNWVADRLGAGAIVEPGQGLRERLRVAIQSLSGDVAVRTEYAHTGWRLLRDQWAYLHAGGAIGVDGPLDGVVVALSGSLGRYRLPDPPAGRDLVEAVQASLALLELLPPEVAYPLLAVVWLAPLREMLSQEPPDFVLWLHGPSGTFKSELSALAMAHYGEFTRTTLPISFAATANAVERICSAAKDALVAVDDYHPASDAKEQAAMAQVASRLLRGVGNGAGRARMRADTSLRPELTPRGVVLVTGERLPDGHSTAARMFPVAVAPRQTDPAKLTIAQDNRSLYPFAMAAYVMHLAGRMDALKVELPRRFTELRQQAARSGGHAREPGQVAHLQLALEVWLGFAVDISATTAQNRDELLKASWAVLLAHAAEHGRALAEETPVRLFLSLLTDGFAGKKAYLEAKDGGTPVEAERWGWEVVPSVNEDYEDKVRHLPAASLLGVVDGDWLLLYPEATYQFVQTASRAAGRSFPVESRTLVRRLDEAGLIAIEPGTGKRTPNVRIGPRTQRVVKLAARALVSDSEGDLPPRNGEQGEQGEHARRAQDGQTTSTHTGSPHAGAPTQLHVPPVPPVPRTEGREGAGFEGEKVGEWSA